jgi:hypothetical protein
MTAAQDSEQLVCALIPVRSQTMNAHVNPARTCQSPGPWHPKPDFDPMLGATDLGAIPGARSVQCPIHGYSLFDSELT